MAENKNFIFDFDSTFIQVEALEELAMISLKGHPEKDRILAEINEVTTLGNNGKISFAESLSRRIPLLKANKTHLDALIRKLKRKVSVSFARNRAFFREYADRIYIVSGGFKEFIDPIVAQYGIPAERVFANSFIFDDAGNIIGFDEDILLSKDNGKVLLLKSLHLTGDIYVIGDGYTDLQIREAGLANKFYVYTENIERESVVSRADHVAPTFEEFLYLNKLPMAISYPKNRINVLLLENIHPEAEAILKKEGYNVEVVNKSPGEKELSERIKDVSILGIRSKTGLTADVLKQAKRLMVTGAFCVGTDQIDLDACSARGLAVFNAPFSNTRSVVELAVGEIIMLSRHITEKNAQMHRGVWAKSVCDCNEIRGKRLGIIGYGNIGSQLSVLAEMMGMEVLYYDIVEKLALGNARKCNSMRELLKKADVVTLHVDGNPENEKMIGEKEFRLMKEGVIFLNLSRGFVVDIKALSKYISNGKIHGAAIDVFEMEPGKSGSGFESELQDMPNVILTPHIGGSTEEAQKNIAEFVSHKIIDYVNTGNSMYSLNFPQLQLPGLQKAHRLIHIHDNIPGMLAKINSILADNDINIVGQYLKTNEKIGYVITDIGRAYNQAVINELKRIPSTIKFRILY